MNFNQSLIDGKDDDDDDDNDNDDDDDDDDNDNDNDDDDNDDDRKQKFAQQLRNPCIELIEANWLKQKQ